MAEDVHPRKRALGNAASCDDDRIGIGIGVGVDGDDGDTDHRKEKEKVVVDVFSWLQHIAVDAIGSFGLRQRG